MTLTADLTNEHKSAISEVTSIQEFVLDRANEGSRGQFAHRLDNWFEWARDEKKDFFEKPSVSGFMELVTHIETLYEPTLVGKAVFFRGQELELALREATEVGFMLRHLLVQEVMSNTKLERDVKDKIVIAHLTRTHHELSDTIQKPRDVEPVDFHTTRSLCLTTVAEYGIKHPVELEEIFTQLANISATKIKSFKKLSDKVNNGDFDNDKGAVSGIVKTRFAKNYPELLQKQKRGLEATRTGVRAEIISEMLTSELLAKDTISKAGESFGFSNLRITRPSTEFDARGLGDFVITGEKGGEEDALLCIEVKVEPESSKTKTIGILTQRRVKTPDGYIVDTEDSDPSVKTVPEASAPFVLETGVPILSMRIPRKWVDDNTGIVLVKGELVKSLTQIVSGKAKEVTLQDISVSKDILANALIKCLKYREEAANE